MAAASLSADQAHAWLRSRRSVRRFAQQAVPRALLERLIETACYAPNSHNRQSWRFVILESRESRARLSQAMGAEFAAVLTAEGMDAEQVAAQQARSRARLHEAPAALLLCVDTSVLDTFVDPGRSVGEYSMAMQGVAMAGGQLLLAAHAEGLGGVWVCAPLFTPQAARQALALPDTWQAQGVVLVGYPDPQRPVVPRPRLPVGDVTRWV